MKLQDVSSEVKLLLTVSVACNVTSLLIIILIKPILSLLIIILIKPILFVGTFCEPTLAVALVDKLVLCNTVMNLAMLCPTFSLILCLF